MRAETKFSARAEQGKLIPWSGDMNKGWEVGQVQAGLAPSVCYGDPGPFAGEARPAEHVKWGRGG